MSRVQLNPAPAYPFAIEIVVRTGDLNHGGHLGHERLLELVQEARVAWLAQYGCTELDCGGVGLIMGDAAVVYRAEVFAGDVLRIEVAVVESTRVGFRLAYRVTRPADDAEVALVETGMAGFDYERRRVVPLPAALQDVDA